MTINFILGLKAGIGTNIAEAETALNLARELKEKIESSDSIEQAKAKLKAKIEAKEYAIHFYDGPKIPDIKNETSGTSLEDDVRKAFNDLKFYEDKYTKNSEEYQKYAGMLEMISRDYSTKALTQFGYCFKMATKRSEEQRLPEGVKRWYIIIDANDMHYWNLNAGTGEVDARLHTIGKTLVNTVRTNKPSEGRPQREIDILDLVSRVPRVVRTNNSAGDEFLIDLYCREKDVVPIVQRLFNKCYEAQKELSGKE